MEPESGSERDGSDGSIGRSVTHLKRIIDISPLITAKMAVWPGDTPVRREVLLDIERGDAITLSTLHATVHLGAHADGPNHYGRGAPGIDARPLEDYLGSCQVVHVIVPTHGRIEPSHLRAEITEERVLLGTGTFSDPNQFRDDFAALAPELVDYLHERGVRLIGIDTPSVDPFDSKDLPAHKRFLALDMAILEGLVLSGVPEGNYELIALPLRLVGFDASPVRAILRTLT
jgi:arylformamidase